MRSYRYLAALVAAALLAAVPATALGYTCTRQPLATSYATGVTQPFLSGVYPRAMTAVLDRQIPFVVFAEVGTLSTAGIWIDSNTTGGSAWMGRYTDPSGANWGRMYYRDQNGATVFDNTFGLNGYPIDLFKIELNTSGAWTVRFWYRGVKVGQHTNFIGNWANTPSTMGATAGITNRASMMWGTPSDHYKFDDLVYTSQYGSDDFDGSSYTQNSNGTYFGAVRDIEPVSGDARLRVWDKNCT